MLLAGLSYTDRLLIGLYEYQHNLRKNGGTGVIWRSRVKTEFTELYQLMCRNHNSRMGELISEKSGVALVTHISKHPSKYELTGPGITRAALLRSAVGLPELV